MAARVFKLRPAGPWRLGPSSGARDRVDRVCHSDTLYSAVSSAMDRLGWREEWFDATARAAEPAVRLGSLFPWQEDALFAPAPGHLWPPPGTSKLRASGARLLPSYLVGWLAAGQPFNEDQWDVDSYSECLIRKGRKRTSPFRVSLRSHAAVDRADHGVTLPHQSACLEFGEDAGLWCAIDAADETWADRVECALRLLGDSGIGGERSQGWGHFEIAETKRGSLAHMLLGGRGAHASSEGAPAYWLLSLLSPAATDRIDWKRGSYELVERGGRIESAAGSGDLKKTVRMVREGSVLLAGEAPVGAAPDVAPAGFPHPVYRAGFALSVPLPWRGNA